jgi:peptidoglycan hydrolase-like protein with peptidoglycan-binding domain
MSPVLLLVVALAVGSVVLALMRAGGRDARSRSLAALAERLGLDYAATDVFNDAWQPFRLFGLGTDRGVADVLYGSMEGAQVRAFEYWYRDDAGDGTSLGEFAVTPTLRFSCAAVTLSASCPRLVVDHRDLGDDLMELVGGDIVELDLEAFDRRFAVRSEDRRFAMALLDQRMMEALMDLPQAATVAVAEDRLLVIARLLPPDGVERLLRSAARLQAVVPRVLSSLYPLRPGFRPGDGASAGHVADPLKGVEIGDGASSEPPGLWWF